MRKETCKASTAAGSVSYLTAATEDAGQEEGVTALPLRHLVAPLAGLQVRAVQVTVQQVQHLQYLKTKVDHQVLDSFLQGFEGKTVGILELPGRADLLPGPGKVSFHHPLHVVGNGQIQVL